jgi:hypothetical protein
MPGDLNRQGQLGVNVWHSAHNYRDEWFEKKLVVIEFIVYCSHGMGIFILLFGINLDKLEMEHKKIKKILNTNAKKSCDGIS